MKRFTALASFVLALLLSFGVVEAAQASMFHAFCKGGVPSKEILVTRMEKSYAANHDGSVKLEGCQANLVQFFKAFKEGDPTATNLVSVADVAAYTSKLKLMTPERDIKYFSSCVKGQSAGPEDVVMNCQPQFIKASVQVYGNPVTGRMTLKLDCANPGLVPVSPPPCDLIVFEVRQTGERRSHHPVYGPGEDVKCHGYVKVALKGGTIRLLGNGGEIAPGCLDQMPSCSYDGADEYAAPRQRTADGTIDGLTPGFYAISVSRGFSSNPANALGICVEYVDPVNGERSTSFTAIVRDIDYKKMSNGQRVARVAYQDTELPTGVRENDPGGLYLWKAR